MRRSALLLMVVCCLGLAAPASAATLAFGPVVDAVQDKPAAITLSGTTEAARSVWAFVVPGTAACAPTPAANTGVPLSTPYGHHYGPGPFAFAADHAPAAVGTHTLCGYLGDAFEASPVMTASATFTVRRSKGTLKLLPGPDATEDRALTITTSGTTEVPRNLFVLVRPGAATCGESPATTEGTPLTSYFGDHQPPGDVSHRAAFTPAAAGTYTLCAFLARASDSAPDVTARATFTARRASGTLHITAPPSLELPGLAQVTVTGTAGAGRYLYVYAHAGDRCPATVAANSGSSLTGYFGDYAAAGRFSRLMTFQPFTAGTWLLCAYLTKSGTATPDATASTPVAVLDPAATPPPTFPDGEPETGALLPAPELLSPAAGVSGERLQPTFSWTAWEDWKSTDELTLSRRERDGSSSPLVTLEFGSYSSFYGDGNEQVESTDDSEDVATFSDDATAVSVALKQVLPPGAYSWSVTRVDGEVLRSEERAFTVLGPRLKQLTVRTRARRGKTSKHPGSSSVSVRTAAAAGVQIELRRQGRVQRLAFTADASGAVDLTVPWSCRRPGGTYRYSVRARDQYGAERTRSGRFTPVSRKACRSLRAKESAARRRAAARREARSEARFRASCRALGGTPADIGTGDGPKLVCRSALGGLLNARR